MLHTRVCNETYNIMYILYSNSLSAKEVIEIVGGADDFKYVTIDSYRIEDKALYL